MNIPTRDYTVSPHWWMNAIHFKEITLLHLYLKSKKKFLVLVARVELRTYDAITSLILALWVWGSNVFNGGARKVEKPFGMLMGTSHVVMGRMSLIRNKCQPSASASFEEKGLSDPGVRVLLCLFWVCLGTVSQCWSKAVCGCSRVDRMQNHCKWLILGSARGWEEIFGSQLRCTLAAKLEQAKKLLFHSNLLRWPLLLCTEMG